MLVASLFVRNAADWVMELPDIIRAIRLLVKDSNQDVRHFVSFLPPILGHESSQEDKVGAAWRGVPELRWGMRSSLGSLPSLRRSQRGFEIQTALMG